VFARGRREGGKGREKGGEEGGKPARVFFYIAFSASLTDDVGLNLKKKKGKKKKRRGENPATARFFGFFGGGRPAPAEEKGKGGVQRGKKKGKRKWVAGVVAPARHVLSSKGERKRKKKGTKASHLIIRRAGEKKEKEMGREKKREK